MTTAAASSINEHHRREATMIMAVTAEFFAVSVDDIRGPRRTKAIAAARQTAMYLCRRLTGLSLPQLGRVFGGRHHTTVLHAEQTIRARVTQHPTIHKQVHELEARILQRHGDGDRGGGSGGGSSGEERSQ